MAKQVGKERGPFEAKNWFVKLKKENQKGETLKRFVLETAQTGLLPRLTGRFEGVTQMTARGPCPQSNDTFFFQVGEGGGKNAA